MKPINIYRSLILPDIADFCQNFFPSLVEHSYEEHKEPPNALRINQKNVCITSFMVWLEDALQLKHPTLNASIEFQLQNIDDKNEAEKIDRYFSYVTARTLNAGINPLAPNNLMSALVFYIEKSTPTKSAPLIEHLKHQFDAVAFGFYKKLNNIFGRYFGKVPLQNTANMALPVFPSTELDALLSEKTQDEIGSTSKSAPSIETPPPPPDSHHINSLANQELVIEFIQNSFREHLSTRTLCPNSFQVVKKIQLPLINLAITSPLQFMAADSKTEILKLVETLSNLNELPAELLLEAKDCIQEFISRTTNKTADIGHTTAALQKIITKKQAPAFHTPKKSVSESEIAPEPTQWILSDQPPAAQSKPMERELISSALMAPMANTHSISIQERAELEITNLLKQNPNSLGEQLNREWISALTVNGHLHGHHSGEWQNCLDIFQRLTTYTSYNEVPLPLLYKVEAQLQFAGVISRDIEINTTPRKPRSSDMNQVKEGSWFEYTKDSQITRCKLAAIIKQIGLYIFVTRHGKKLLEVNAEVLQEYLDSGVLRALETATNKTLEEILTNIKSAQTAEQYED